jgi:oligopeptide transport system permease protein
MSGVSRALRRIPWGYVARRLLVAIPTLLVIITLAFFLMRLAPGSPFSVEGRTSDKAIAALEAQYGLDRPIQEQYFSYLAGVVQGDFGPSLKTKDKTVSEMIGEGLPISMTLGFSAMLLAMILGSAIGIFAGLRQNTAGDYASMGFAMIGISIPTFVTGPILALVVGIWLGWLPSAGLTERITAMGVERVMTVEAMILPVITLALPFIAIISRLMRASMIETLRSNHIRTARAKGLSERTVILRHALPQAMLPLVSFIGPATAGVVTGSLVIERVFALPGVGSYFVQGALDRDFTLVMGVVILFATLIILLNLLADIIYSVLDPKVRYE